MNKDVLISIVGLQFEVDQEEPVEVISVGTYYKRNGKHYLIYDEISVENDGATSCTMKIIDKKVDLLKRGPVNVHMLFEEGTKNTTMYNTPFGALQVGILTKKVELLEEDDKIEVKIEYALDINFSHVSDCEITITIRPRNVNKD